MYIVAPKKTGKLRSGIILILILCNLVSCEWLPKPEAEEVPEEAMDCHLLNYMENFNEQRKELGLYPIKDGYRVNWQDDSTYVTFSKLDENWYTGKPFHSAKTIECFEGDIIEIDYYYGGKSYLRTSSEGPEYPLDTLLDNMTVTYFHFADSFDIHIRTSTNRMDPNKSNLEWYHDKSKIDSILKVWGFKRF